MNSESKSHICWKTHFTKNLTNTLTSYGQKLKFWSNCWILLDFKPSCRAYFFLQNDRLQAKIKAKMDKISQKYQTLIKSLLYFSGKLAVFYPNSRINCTGWARTGTNRLDHLEEHGLSQLLPKGLVNIDSWLKDMNFSREDVQNFSVFQHSSKSNEVRIIGN